MNELDKKVLELLVDMNMKTLKELENHLLNQFLKMSKEYQNSLETFFEQFPFWGELNIKNKNTEEIHKRAKFLKENVDSLKEMYDSLNDYRSKKVFYAILKNWYEYDCQTLQSVIENTYEHYFDLDIIPHAKNEVFVDLGAYIGDTILSFINTYGLDSYNQIFAYEMSEKAVTYLQENVSNLPNINISEKAVADFVGKGSILENTQNISANQLLSNEKGVIPVTTLDEDIKEEITMIKMDIEGSEQKAIEGARKHIKNEKPKLLLSVYHGYPDFIEIWQKVKEIEPNYKFYLRYYGNHLFPTEIVLYAV